MKYPKAIEPFKNHTEFLAWTYSQLAAAYAMLAQYEREEENRERDLLRDMLSKPTDMPER